MDPFFMKKFTKAIPHDLTFNEIVNLAKQLNPSRFDVSITDNYNPDIFENICVLRIYDRSNHMLYSYSTASQSNTSAIIFLLNRELVEVQDEWDVRFLRLADGELNSWSKDPSTKVSAVIIRGKYPIATSYNGFPPGIEDTDERLNNRELKYKLVQHAEANAISTCAKLGISTEGTTMAVTHFPCSTCAGLMISAGIKKVIVKKPTPDFLSRWKESIDLSKEMFKEAEVELVVIDLDGEK